MRAETVFPDKIPDKEKDVEKRRFTIHRINCLPALPAVIKNMLIRHADIKAFFEVTSENELKEVLKPCIPFDKSTYFNQRTFSALFHDLTSREISENALRSFKMAKQTGIRIITIEDDDYPERLRNIYDPPAVLYVKGRLPDDDKFSVGIVGSRNCTEQGKKRAAEFAKGLSEAGISIISGMARGIDNAAQTAAVTEAGGSFAVLGNGPDVVYPESSRRLYELLSENGGVISEYPPGTCPVPENFPKRNRIIAALSDALVLIEAGERSGSLITAKLALEYGKDVFAVPGRPEDICSMGCNRLIADSGAALVTSVRDILFILSSEINV